MVHDIYYMLVALIGAHFICDITLQSSDMAIGKSAIRDFPYKNVPWYYWMIAHCATHAFFVLILTQSLFLSFCMFITHFCVDVGKCFNKFNIHVDQMLHLLVILILWNIWAW